MHDIIAMLSFTPCYRTAIIGSSMVVGVSVASGTGIPKITAGTWLNSDLVRRLLAIINGSSWFPADFDFSSIAINLDTLAKDHVDFNNVGPSLALAVSSNDEALKGGELEVLQNGTWSVVGGKLVIKSGTWQPFNIINHTLKFDGNTPHRSLAFSGASRSSMIFFSHTSAYLLDADEEDRLRDWGFHWQRALADKPHVFLSHYSGKGVNCLAAEVVKEASAHGHTVRPITRDMAKDGCNLLGPSPYLEDRDRIRKGSCLVFMLDGLAVPFLVFVSRGRESGRPQSEIVLTFWAYPRTHRANKGKPTRAHWRRLVLHTSARNYVWSR